VTLDYVHNEKGKTGHGARPFFLTLVLERERQGNLPAERVSS